MKEVILKIEGMVCVNCENLIEDILLDNNGVNKVEVSYTKGLAKINYNEKIIYFSGEFENDGSQNCHFDFLKNSFF